MASEPRLTVFSPAVTSAIGTLAHDTKGANDTPETSVDGVREITKVWKARAGMSTGVFGSPMAPFVAGSVR